MPDTIYNDLKEQGLILSEGAVLQLPPIRPPKPSLIRQIGGILAQQFKIGQGPHKVVILPVLNSAVLVGRANTLICYKFELDKQTGTPIFQEPKIENLPFVIKALHICDNKFLNDRGEVPFLIEAEDRLVLFYVDLKEYKLIERNSLSYSQLYSVRFLCEKEVLLLTRQLQIHHFTIQGGKIRMKNKKISAALPEIPKDQYIQHCQIVGSIDEEQDSVIAMFYLIKKRKKGVGKEEEQQKNFQVLKVKQYLRTFEGKIEPQEQDYTVMMNLHSSVLPQNFQIWCLDGYYCIETKHQILILKKKFKKYLFIDNVMEKIHDHNLKLNSGALVSSYGNKTMELSVIQFGDPKCNSKILDTIELDPNLNEGLRMIWPFKNQKETCLMVAFEREKKLIFHNIIKMEPMKKMLQVVKSCDKNKISVVQQIAVNLGINKKDFYITLWQSSKRQLNDIYQFLLPCGDVSSIKKEIRLTMRRKKIYVFQFVKILERIGQIIKNQLKTNLSQQMLKEYIKNDFLLRKIKLKQKDKSLDHRDLDKVYNSSLTDMFVQIVKTDLYPQVKKVDPLHAMVFEPEKQIIDLRHVFQEFKIVILQNYKKFIVDFLAMFTSKQLINVIKNYSYLLPFYPFQLNMFMHETEYKTEVELNVEMARSNNGQNLWFSHMTSIEFNRQLSKERIERELHEYYPTSKITDAINTLVNSAYGGSEKLRKHGLISCTIDEYKNKLKDIYNIKLFMKVCEHANEYDPFSDLELSPELVQIFKKENKLTGQAYQTVRLYSSMHKFMLKNDFCEKKNGSDRGGFTTQELIQFTSQDLVALFFLQNRQRKQFLFNQFRDLYVKLYGNADIFNQVIKKFIHSENCSRIQLEIFIKEVLNKGIDFQIDNQPLIELLIDGFCMKLQIREDTDTKHFIELMEEIELSKNLGMKINKIMQIRRCIGILNVFHCQKFTYFQMLQYQQNNQIFKILLDRYFTQNLKRDSVRIEDQQISLEYCRNMLTVLLFILETVYYDVSQKQLLLTYGQILIDWKQFDVIKGILYDEDVLQKLNINKDEYIEELVRNSLNTIYTDQSIEFDDEVKKQIEDILDIMQGESNPLRRRQLAKLKLVGIFEGWEVIVHPFDIYSVVEEWNVNNGKQEFITNLFDVYLDKIKMETLALIYTYLQLTADNLPQDAVQVNLNNSIYTKFLLMFAQRLLKLNRYEEIIQIFAFVKQMNGTLIEYELLTQAFLKSVCQKYRDTDYRQSGKELIEYFTQNVFDDKIMQELFESNFDKGKFGSEIERDTEILVDAAYCFRRHKVQISIELLWKVVVDEINEREKVGKLSRQYNEELYYAYYFILFIFRNPTLGLRKLDRISYNLEILTSLLQRLEIAIDENSTLWAINTFYIFKNYIKGLLLIGLARVRQAENITSQKFKQEENLQVIKNALKEDKIHNKDLLDSIQKIQSYTNASKNTKKNEKEIRFQKSKLLEQENKPKETEPEPKEEIVVNNATMNLKIMREMKYEYTQMSNMSVDYISEKEVLEAIYNRMFDDKQQARAKQRREAGGGNNLFLTGIGNHKRDVAQKEVVDKILKEDFEEVLQNYPKEDIVEAVRNLYTEGKKNFEELINIMDTLKIGVKEKIELGRTCKIYHGEVTMEDMRHIFPFDYFIYQDRCSEEEFGDYAYNSIRKNIQEQFMARDNDFIRSMAAFMGSVLGANKFIDKIYIDTLISIGESYSFNPDSIIRFRVIIDQCNPYMIRDNLSAILKACKQNVQLKPIIKQQLQLVVKQHFNGQQQLLDQIRNY